MTTDSKKQIEEISLSKNDLKKIRQNMWSIGNEKTSKDIYFMFQSRYKVIYIQSNEESRVINYFKLMSTSEGMDLYTWDISRGLIDAFTHERIASIDNMIHGDPQAILSYIIDVAKSDEAKQIENHPLGNGRVYMLLDFHSFLLPHEPIPIIERRLKEFADMYSECTIVIVSPVFNCSPALEKTFTLVNFPYPSKYEIKQSLNKILKEIPMNFPNAKKTAKKKEEEIIKAASGLTLVETENALAKTLVKNNDFVIKTILDEKKQIISKGKILEYIEPRFTMKNVGGLEYLKEWLANRRNAFKEDARNFGLPTPRGILLLGIPGVGKSLICEALAHEWEIPLVRLDFGSIFASHVGETEANLRACLNCVQSLSPVILWIDEIEKGIGGVKSSNETDGGVTNRVFGTLLTWMQDKEEDAYVVCTGNDHTALPPEFLRAGRFDEIFFLDLPTQDERFDVCSKLLIKKNRDPKKFDINKIANHSKNYTPVEIEKAIDNGLFRAYSDNKRELDTEDILIEIENFQPLYNSCREKLSEIRDWALGDEDENGNRTGGRAVRANTNAKTKKITESTSLPGEPPKEYLENLLNKRNIRMRTS